MAEKRALRTASPTLRAIFETADRLGISRAEHGLRIGSRQHEIYRWRRGDCNRTPNIMTVEELAHAIGHRLELVPIKTLRTA